MKWMYVMKFKQLIQDIESLHWIEYYNRTRIRIGNQWLLVIEWINKINEFNDCSWGAAAIAAALIL